MEKAILLVNLGTPNSPKPKDVFRYLIEFLTDKRVIDLPFLKRQLLVRSIIVPLRYKTSARSYKAIWTENGFPLLHYGRSVQNALQKRLAKTHFVKLAMRYQTPSIDVALESLREEGISHLTVLPLFPQYSSACTGSIFEKVTKLISRWQTVPTLEFISHFYNHPAYLEALSETARPYLEKHFDHVLMSFHGLPESHLKKDDCFQHCLQKQGCCEKIGKENRLCYRAHCFQTAKALQSRLNLPESKVSITFQSRLGKEPWLTPFTEDTLKELANKGKKHVLVFCPSFVADCLETLYEIDVEYNEVFQKHGGESLTLVKSLNDQAIWIEALEKIVLKLPSKQADALQTLSKASTTI